MAYPERFRKAASILIVGLILASPAWGKDHPAAKTATSYLKAVALRDWKTAVTLVEAKSLENLKRDQIIYLKRAPTMKAEEALLGRLGVASIEELEAKPAKEVYILRSNAQTVGDPETNPEIKEVLAQVKRTLAFRVLGTVIDNASLVHVLVRSNHERRKRNISALDVVSLEKVGKAWKVSLDAQQPLVTNIDAKKK